MRDLGDVDAVPPEESLIERRVASDLVQGPPELPGLDAVQRPGRAGTRGETVRGLDRAAVYQARDGTGRPADEPLAPDGLVPAGRRGSSAHRSDPRCQ